jgi:hypothetical protein
MHAFVPAGVDPDRSSPDPYLIPAVLRGDAILSHHAALDINDAEPEYTERIRLGELMPELLSPDHEAIADRLRRHPALRCKAENATLYARGTRSNERGARARR